jgi:hypothetical protein
LQLMQASTSMTEPAASRHIFTTRMNIGSETA